MKETVMLNKAKYELRPTRGRRRRKRPPPTPVTPVSEGSLYDEEGNYYGDEEQRGYGGGDGGGGGGGGGYGDSDGDGYGDATTIHHNGMAMRR